MNLKNYKLIETEDGSTTLYSERYQEACHSTHGARAETRLHYIEGCKVTDFLSEQNSIHILEVGFGTGIGLEETMKVCKDSQLLFTTFEIDPELAEHSLKRLGLSYTRIDSDFIVETNLNFKVTNNKGKEVDIGSICSGGAYAKLISRFRGVDIPGTGISFGVDRLLFALMQLDQIKVEDQKPVLVCVMDKKYLKNYYELVDQLRDNNINAEIFLDSKKNLGKQLTFANKRDLSVAIICGENEFKEKTVTIKNLKGIKGENNQTIPKEDLINEVKKLI